MLKLTKEFQVSYRAILTSAIFALAFTTTLAANAQEQIMTPLEIVKSTYEGVTSEENGRNLQRQLAGDAKWTEAAGFPYAGTYTGFSEIAENVFARLGSEWTDYRFVPEGYVADDKRVVAYGTYYGAYNETGKEFTARVAHVWLIENCRIVKFEQFVDSVPVVDAMK